MFNVRVYGILINDQHEILVSDLLFHGKQFTKFVGGGLEFGEGTKDCLKREFKEELNLDVEVGEHIYTTDFFQQSAFNPAHQIISIYYAVKPLHEIRAHMVTIPFDFTEEEISLHQATGEAEVFRFIPMSLFSAGSLSLPIDKIVAEIIK